MTVQTIGQLAKAAGVNIETIRYYERRGLVPETLRRPSGYRQYDTDTIKRVRFIRQSQGFGFSLHDVEELLALGVDASVSNVQIEQEVETKNAEIVQKIQVLRQMREALSQLISMPRESRATSENPLLAVFENNN